MLTPVFSLSAGTLKYEASLAESVAVSYSFSGNLMTSPLTQVGRSIATRMRNAPSPASTSPMTPRIVPPGICRLPLSSLLPPSQLTAARSRHITVTGSIFGREGSPSDRKERWHRDGGAAGPRGAPGERGSRGVRAMAAGDPGPGDRAAPHRRAAAVEGRAARTVFLPA